EGTTAATCASPLPNFHPAIMASTHSSLTRRSEANRTGLSTADLVADVKGTRHSAQQPSPDAVCANRACVAPVSATQRGQEQAMSDAQVAYPIGSLCSRPRHPRGGMDRCGALVGAGARCDPHQPIGDSAPNLDFRLALARESG